jgi:hypothetical protein
MEMESPVPGGCLVFSGAVMAVEGDMGVRAGLCVICGL